MWLVKSGSVVSGPYTFEELVEKIQSKEVVLHDEVIAPLARWRYVREQSEFAEVVFKVRHNQSADREDTQTASSTEELVLNESGAGNNAPGDYNAPVPQVEGHIVSRVYGDIQNEKIQREVRLSARNGWVFVLFILLSLGSYIWWMQMQQVKKSTSPDAQHDLVYKANESLRIGEFARATQYFSKILAISPGDIEANLSLAMLLVMQERQTVEARRILQKLNENQLPPKDQIRWRTISALISISDGDWSEAANQIQSALKIDPNYEPALLNLGTIQHQRGNFEQARATFQKVTKSKEFAHLGQILSLRTLLDRAEKNDVSKSSLVDAGAQLMRLGREFTDFRQEAFYLASYAYLLAGDNDQAQIAAEKALDIDPRLTDQHWHSQLVSLRLLEWTGLATFCPKIVGINSSLARLRAFNGFCKAKMGRWIEARRDFEEAIVMNDRDSLTRGIFAAFLVENDRQIEARSTLLINPNERFDLPLIVSARVCDKEEDPDCASEYWQQLLKLNSASLPALVGMAEELTAYRPAEAHMYLQKAVQISPHYIPLLKIMRPSKGDLF